MVEIYRKIFRITTSQNKSGPFSLLIVMLFIGIFEALGAASLLPFVHMIDHAEIINSNKYLNAIYETLGFSSTDSFILFSGIIVFILIVVGFTFRAYSNYTISKFVNSNSYNISKDVLNTYLSQPYSWFLNRHSANLGKTIVFDSDYVSKYILMPAFRTISHVTVSLFYIVLLCFVDAGLALTSIAILVCIFALLYFVFYRQRGILGRKTYNSIKDINKSIHETLGGIKEIKIFGMESIGVNTYATQAKIQTNSQIRLNVISEAPSLILQAVSFGGIIAFLLIMILMKGTSIQNMLPTLTIFAFAGLRLIPAFQSIYRDLSQVHSASPALETIYNDLEILKTRNSAKKTTIISGKLELTKNIQLQNIRYFYPNSDNRVLDSIDLDIKVGSTIALVASTGAGKSTLVDIIMGLLTPSSGNILVDNIELNDGNIREWQNTIGYVPQQIYLRDDSFVKNIAFGVPDDEIDFEQVQKVAKLAMLEDVILNSSLDTYETKIGENGVRLSGGQKQRIGIARALYRNPSLLILDEATNAIDYDTEKFIMKNIKMMKSIKTIILVTHRLNSIKHCDKVYDIQKGQIKEEKAYMNL